MVAKELCGFYGVAMWFQCYSEWLLKELCGF